MKAPTRLQKHTTRAVGLKRHFCDAGTDSSTAVRFPASTGSARNWGYQRVANRGYRTVEIITRHALATGSGALGDGVVVQQDPRAVVDIHSYRASSRYALCL